MRRLYLLYRQNIFTAAIVTVMLSWALTSTFFAIRKNDKLILLKISAEGVSPIDAEHASEDLIQVKTFLRRYIQLMYNYDFLSFEENVNKVSFILSDSFWRKVHDGMTSTKKSIDSAKITQTSAIEKLSKLGPNSYELVVQTVISKTTGESKISQNQKFKLKVNLDEVKRSLENPWGMEVTDATEERLM